MKMSVLLYGAAGSGKTVSALSYLKNPKYSIRVLALDTNSLIGIEDAIKIHNVTLKAGQLVVATTKQKKAVFSDTVVSKGDSSDFIAINSQLNNFTGIDYFTKENVSCGSICDFDENTVFILDSLSTWQDTIRSHATKSLLSQQKNPENGVNGMSLIGEMQNLILSLSEMIQKNINCKFILLAHEAVNSAEAVEDSKGTLKNITPNFPGVKNTSQFLGKFSVVLYCKYLPMSGKYVWVGSDIKDTIAAVPRGIPRDKQLKFNELVPDFTSTLYSFE